MADGFQGQLRVGQAGQNNDRHLGSAAIDGRKNLETLKVGQRQVQEYEVVVMPLGETVEGLAEALDPVDPVLVLTLPIEVITQKLSIIGIVFYQENR
jgi:hypothetical protein